MGGCRQYFPQTNAGKTILSLRCSNGVLDSVLDLAADWGRFSTYYFMLMVTLPFWSAASTEASETAPNEQVPRFIEAITLRLEWVSQFTLIRITALIALTGSPFFAARVYGMNLRDLLCVAFVGVFAAAQSRWADP